MIIGIDASRANLPKKTGTEWYSYFLIEELKRLANNFFFSHLGEGASIRLGGRGADEAGDEAKGQSGIKPQDVEFVLYSKEPLQGDLGKLPRNFQSKILFWPLKLLWTQIRLSWETLVSPPDVLFIPAHTIPVIGRAKTVMTVHDVGFKVFPELYSWKDILYHRFSIWWASRFAWKIICPSEFTKNELIKYYGTDRDKIVVIPHGVNVAEGFSLPSSLQLRGGLKTSATFEEFKRQDFLLYVGRLEKKKNILGILRAFKIVLEKYADIKLVLAGQPGYGMERILELILELNLRDAVEIKGYVTEQEKSELYKGALVFVFPTFYEGFGMPILEAQSYGCPVVTSNKSANTEVAGDSTVLVDQYKVEDIAEAISRLLEDEADRKSIIEKGFENIKKYSWQRAAEQTWRVLVDKR